MSSKEYTPTQVAQIVHVSTRTVLRWFDAGRLRGYRHDGTQRRRIPHDNLVAFLKEHNLPLVGLDDAGARDQ